MLRSALVAVRSAVLQPEYSRQLSYVQVSRLFGTQLRYYSVQSNPDTSSNVSKDEPNKDQKTSETETKTADSAKEEKESEHDRLLKEKEGLIKDLQVCHKYFNVIDAGRNMWIISIVDKIRLLSIEFNTNQSTNIGNR